MYQNTSIQFALWGLERMNILCCEYSCIILDTESVIIRLLQLV